MGADPGDVVQSLVALSVWLMSDGVTVLDGERVLGLGNTRLVARFERNPGEIPDVLIFSRDA